MSIDMSLFDDMLDVDDDTPPEPVMPEYPDGPEEPPELEERPRPAQVTGLDSVESTQASPEKIEPLSDEAVEAQIASARRILALCSAPAIPRAPRLDTKKLFEIASKTAIELVKKRALDAQSAIQNPEESLDILGSDDADGRSESDSQASNIAISKKSEGAQKPYAKQLFAPTGEDTYGVMAARRVIERNQKTVTFEPTEFTLHEVARLRILNDATARGEGIPKESS